MNYQHAHLIERSAIDVPYQPETLSWAQLESGTFDVRYGVVNASPVEISFRGYNVGFQAEVRVAPDRCVFLMMAQPSKHTRWFGTALDLDSIAATRSLVAVRTAGAAAFFRVTVDERLLGLHFPSAPDAYDLVENTWERTLTRSPIHAARIRASLRHAFETHPIPPRLVAGTIIPLLAAVTIDFADGYVEFSKCVGRRLSAVRVCEAYMREHVDSSLTLLDLSAVARMRSRSLINAFEAVTGFSPMDYLKRLRLNGARRALQSADKARTRIIDVATSWGFWHMGHFATDYRRLFGESPSQTLLN